MKDFLILTETFQLSQWEWFLALLAAFTLGIAKSGLKGISIIIVTLMALVFGSKASTGIILPLLLVGDVMAVIYYRKHTQWKYLWRLLPWMMLGVIFGAYVGKDLPEATFKMGMAIIILISVIIMYWWEKRDSKVVPTQWWFAGIMGTLAGFTTMIGNLAGAFSNIFFLAMRLPKNEFIGTAAWLFLLINIFKLPFHIFSWGTITPSTIAVDIRLSLGIVAGFFVGVRIISWIKDYQYRKLILALTAMGAILIFLRN